MRMPASAPVAVERNDLLAVAPPPRLVVWELPFWLILLYIALTPGSVSPWWVWGGIPVRSAEVVVLVGVVWYLPSALLLQRAWRAWPAIWILMAPMLIALAYAALSTGWNGLDDSDTAAMRITLLFAMAGPLLAWSVTGGYTRDELYHFIWRLTAFMALLSVLYSAESILSLGLRSELGQNTLLDFGIERVRGPLYGSSTGYLALLPALAFSIQHVIDVHSRRLIGVAVVLALLLALLGLGSRAALLLLAVYLLLLSFLIKSARKRLIAVILMVVLTVLAATVVFSQASTDRLQTFEDDSRRATHVTALRTVESLDLASNLRGAGYGGIWNWYLTDALNGERLATGDNLIRTSLGTSLYHSHSTLLEMGMELGLVGLVAFAAMTFGFVAAVVACWRRGVLQAFSCGLLATGLGLVFDLFLFKNTTVNLIWWFYALSMLMLAHTKRAGQR
jgi:O-antigen ligase